MRGQWLRRSRVARPGGRRFRRNNFNLKYGGPLLAGDVEAVALRVVGDAVEDGLGVDFFIFGEQAGEIDPGDDVAVVGRDARDTVGVPDVGVNFAGGGFGVGEGFLVGG